MGYVKVKVKVRNPQQRVLEAEVELLADTGVIYSIIPSKMLESIEIERRSVRRMRLTDGRVIERHVGIAEIEVRGETARSNVIFGEDEDAPVLGVTALEEPGYKSTL